MPGKRNHGKCDFDNYIENNVSLSFHSITENDLILAINSTKSNATGYDNIPIKYIKIIFPLIISTLSRFPTAWKLGRVILISKNCIHSNKNLRPITILPMF